MFRKLLFLVFLFPVLPVKACSILYYIDSTSGKIYAVNNEDFWFNVKASVNIVPASKKGLARLWYGWDNFAQGGVNEAGLFFDGAATPEETPVPGHAKPKGNLGDRILAHCRTVDEALAWLEREKVALTNGHLLFGDTTGNAVVVEWVDGTRNIVPITGNSLAATNFLLSDPARGNYPCPRYAAMEAEIARLAQAGSPVGMQEVGNILAQAVQPPATNADGKEGGTLYSTFINLTDGQFLIVYKLDNTKRTAIDLRAAFASGKKQKIRLR